MKTKSLLALAFCAILGTSFTAVAQDDSGSAPKITDCFTIYPTPGEIPYQTMVSAGFTYVSLTPLSDYIPSKNESCTSPVVLLLNDEELNQIKPSDVTVMATEYHGMTFYSCSIPLNPNSEKDASLFQQAGTYKVQIPADLIMVNDEGTEACELVYTFTEPVEGNFDYPSSLRTSSGAYFYSISPSFENASLLTYILDDFKCDLYFGDTLLATLDKTNASAYGGNSFTINIPQDVRDNAALGEYTFKVQPNSIKVVNPAENVYAINDVNLEYSYTLIAPASYEMTPASGSEVNALKEFTLTFNRQIKNLEGFFPLSITDADNDTWDNDIEIEISEDMHTATVRIDPPIYQAGTYSINNLASWIGYEETEGTGYFYPWPSPIEAIFTVVQPSILDNFTLTPAPGNLDYRTMQNGLTYISFSPNSGVTPAVNPDVTDNIELLFNDETLVNIEPKYLSFSYIDMHGGFWSGSLTLNPDNVLPLDKLRQPGTYTVKIPANLVQVNGVNTAACTLEYTYTPPVEGDIDFASALGTSEGDAFYSIYVKMDDYNLAISIENDFKCEMIYDGEVAYTFDSTNASSFGSNSFSINFPSEVTQNAKVGEYTFNVFPGSIKAVDTANNIYSLNPTTLTYTYNLIAPPGVVSMTPENGSTVNELSEIIITFNRLMGEVTPYNADQVKLQVMQGEEVLDDYEVELTTVEDAYEGNDVMITISPAITENGVYSIANIASYVAFKLNPSDSWPTYWYYGPIECQFTVDVNTGVSILPSDNGLYTVYNLQGMALLQEAGIEAVRALKPGIYVVNGKKVMLK